VQQGKLVLRSKIISASNILESGEGNLIFDTVKNENEYIFKSIYCIELLRERSLSYIVKDSEIYVTALLLQATTTLNTFRRVGVARLLPTHWFDLPYDVEITII
jgi:hypothetical protein